MTPSARWMGATWRTVASCVHFNCGIFRHNSIVITAPRNFSVSACQRLFAKDSLGLDRYEADRVATATQLDTREEVFRKRMEQYLTTNSNFFNVTVTEDLKKMCYLAQDDKDLQIINKMLKKYVQQYGRSRTGSFVFGPLLMRLHYHLNKPEAALSSIQDPVLAEVYDQLTSYMVAMNLLYNHQRYNDVVQLYTYMLQRPFIATRFPRENLALACAACYKLGTAEAYATARGWIQGAVDKQAPVMRKAAAFVVALALKTNDAAGALELQGSFHSHQSYMSSRNLRVLALTRLGRLDEVLPILGWTAAQDSAAKRAGLAFFQDVMAEVKAAVAVSNAAELRREFERIFAALEEDAVDAQTLEEFLERPFMDAIERAAFQSQRSENERPRTYVPPSAEGRRYGRDLGRPERGRWSAAGAGGAADSRRDNRRGSGREHEDSDYDWDPAAKKAR
ncbi:pentatricopeptide repeat-containing protein 2, mitochondrial-like [Paramacrobiotus metropolitanus]|uniref:pentatricopeptide repeat-containing protein 2, mitochondrial-like n=1 Tax=Paramacrobiotus metropolitanus TaxID=2943436 RepID=UPI002446484A|nr:pentatricopeptide repeat-containing protein 2, mitochondrial-like [Paramacrobiotus metropolitanus]